MRSKEDRRIPRREFLKVAVAGMAATTLEHQPLFAARSKPPKRPNILLIMSDEHNPFAGGFVGNRIVRTPNLDALAAEGIVFDNHYCNSPLCVPSRLSFTSGKYISRTSAWDNSSWLPSDNIPSLARCVTAAGYQSFLCGKMHYDRTRRYGFIEVGGNFNDHFKDGRGKRLSPEFTHSSRLAPFFGMSGVGEISYTLDHDRAVTKGALEFLGTRRAADNPFFLLVGYLAPHFPLVAPRQFYNHYKDRVPMPEIPAGFVDSLPTNYKVMRAGMGVTDVPDATVKFNRELYYGLTEWFDTEMQKVVDKLRSDKELADNTIIIYTSDHGENRGEHSMWQKCCMFEQSAHVPTIFSFPARWEGGQRRTLVSSHVDLVKTIIDLAGGTAPADWDGDSLVPYLDNAHYAWKDFALSEYYASDIASGFTMVRLGKWKYTYHAVIDSTHPDERELYDLSADPKEFHNLARLPEYQDQLAQMHTLMIKELRGVDPNVTEERCRSNFAVGYRRTDALPRDHSPDAAWIESWAPGTPVVKGLPPASMPR